MSIQDALKGIRRRYADHLHDHRAQLSNLVQDARQGPDPVAAIEQIRFRAHKISGTAATLGFQSLGGNGRLVRAARKRLPRGAGACGPHACGCHAADRPDR
ncbi:hypothetical protein ACFOHS_03655 [Jhaorihella thermophila]